MNKTIFFQRTFFPFFTFFPVSFFYNVKHLTKKRKWEMMVLNKWINEWKWKCCLVGALLLYLDYSTTLYRRNCFALFLSLLSFFAVIAVVVVRCSLKTSKKWQLKLIMNWVIIIDLITEIIIIKIVIGHFFSNFLFLYSKTT